MKKGLIVIFLALLTSCYGKNDLANNQNAANCFNSVKIQSGKLIPVYCNDLKKNRELKTEHYTISIPGNLFRFDNSADEIVFDSNATNDNSVLSDYDIRIYNRTHASASPACSSSALQELDPHARPLLELKETSNPSNDILTIRGVQRPTGPEVEMSEENLKEWWSYQDTRYLFCSEHAGKSVVIVIAQKTDDPKLANEIFDSFRWLP